VVDDAVSHGKEPIVKVHAPARVVRDHLQVVAERRALGERRNVYVAVLLVDEPSPD
jgi:hypothetical protein